MTRVQKQEAKRKAEEISDSTGTPDLIILTNALYEIAASTGQENSFCIEEQERTEYSGKPYEAAEQKASEIAGSMKIDELREVVTGLCRIARKRTREYLSHRTKTP
jgi:hypothetical protein